MVQQKSGSDAASWDAASTVDFPQLVGFHALRKPSETTQEQAAVARCHQV